MCLGSDVTEVQKTIAAVDGHEEISEHDGDDSHELRKTGTFVSTWANMHAYKVHG
jgi:hypothetical protein